ncbi:acetyl-CoA carboxylase biotin carboxylase subunit family protein [Nocardia sp. NPDC059691]|uniref:ATP-grasp domain-containing protein n=1 Tax=Nocardia sp. NPDC059691 TaxID=3346908 RepID=UPI0036ADD63B
MTVIHRVRGVDVPYTERIDHVRNLVTYVCASGLPDGIPEQAAAVTVLDGATPVHGAVRDLAARFGTPERIVALHEFDLFAAAELRAEFDIPGDRAEYVTRFRDKLTMAQAVAARNVSVPAFRAAPDLSSVAEFATASGFPIIVKPRFGAGSRDVVKLNSEADLAALPDLASEPFLVQEFCPDEVGAIDGVWTGSQLGPWRASKYLGTCLDFANDAESLGYVEVDDPALTGTLTEFAESVLCALSPGVPTVFHLEFFVGGDGDSPRVQFLEVAARACGGQTTHMWREVHRYDLLGAAVDIQLGRTPATAPLTDGEVVAELLIHPPVTPPCRVVDVHWAVPEAYAPYHCSIPQVGSVITETFGYADIGAAFRIRGKSTAEVLESVRRTVAGFRMMCTALDSPVAVAVA